MFNKNTTLPQVTQYATYRKTNERLCEYGLVLLRMKYQLQESTHFQKENVLS